MESHSLIFFADKVMYRCIVEDDDDVLAVGVLHCQSIDEIDDLGPFDRAFMHDMHERVGDIVERAKHVHLLAAAQWSTSAATMHAARWVRSTLSPPVAICAFVPRCLS